MNMNEFKNVNELVDYLDLMCISENKDLEIVYIESFDDMYKSITGVYKCKYVEEDDMFDYIGIGYEADKKPLTLEQLILELNKWKADRSFVGLINANETGYLYPQGIYDFKLKEIETLGEKDKFLEIYAY